MSTEVKIFIKVIIAICYISTNNIRDIKFR